MEFNQHKSCHWRCIKRLESSQRKYPCGQNQRRLIETLSDKHWRKYCQSGILLSYISCFEFQHRYDIIREKHHQDALLQQEHIMSVWESQQLAKNWLHPTFWHSIAFVSQAAKLKRLPFQTKSKFHFHFFSLLVCIREFPNSTSNL